ncbi:hypothetical protein PR002_g28334 [Phytophthora rubi]|uniref:Uncharacterized protein n=1 Tax=Phytophthora rubi TaxID=129364 RepID=A0A6A3HAK8_9STRA|nr:hypothetical protein PR002_g28334 [Phytophthora rubi]
MARQGSRNESIISSDDADLEEDQDRDDVTTSSSTNAVDVIQRPSRSSSRSAQHVNTIQQRRRVVLWMLQFEKREGNKNMFARAVDEFPDVFNSATRNANLNKAIAWWKKRDQLAQPSRGSNKVRSDGVWSGKLKNPGKRYFLTLAAKAVRRVNAQRDKNGLNYARKAMIRCGLSLDVDGKWRVEQLFSHLQEIIRKYPDEFTGKHVGSASLSGEGDASTRPPSSSSSITEAVV